MVSPNYSAYYGATPTETQDTGSGSNVTLIAAPGSGLRTVIHDLQLNSNGATVFTLETTEGGSPVTRDYDLDGITPYNIENWRLIVDDNTLVAFSTSVASINTNISITTGQQPITAV